jgi:hypothetical protein
VRVCDRGATGGEPRKRVLLWAGVGYEADAICSCALLFLDRLRGACG